MIKKIDLLVHGPLISKKGSIEFNCFENLKSLINRSNIFNSIIISTWISEDTFKLEKYLKKKNIFIIKSKIPIKKSFSNSNLNPSKNKYLQTYSVLQGLKFLKKLNNKNNIINNESFVIKIRTDHKYPDYLGLIKYIKNKKISNTTICVKAFRPSIPFFLGDGILIGKLELLFKLFNNHYSQLQMYNNTHYDLFAFFSKLVTPKKIMNRNFILPSSFALLSQQKNLTLRQLELVKNLWLKNINLIPKKLIFPFFCRGKIQTLFSHEIYFEDLNSKYFERYFNNLKNIAENSSKLNPLKYSLRLYFVHSNNKIILTIGLFLQFLKSLCIKIFYLNLKICLWIKGLFNFIIKAF
jgi:hypothetical protein